MQTSVLSECKIRLSVDKLWLSRLRGLRRMSRMAQIRKWGRIKWIICWLDFTINIPEKNPGNFCQTWKNPTYQKRKQKEKEWNRLVRIILLLSAVTAVMVMVIALAVLIIGAGRLKTKEEKETDDKAQLKWLHSLRLGQKTQDRGDWKLQKKDTSRTEGPVNK